MSEACGRVPEHSAGISGCEGCPSCTGEETKKHADIAADILNEYVLARILDRIEAEPDLLQRSILAMREDREPTAEIVDELGPLESDPRVVRQVNKLSRATVATVYDIEPAAFRLTVRYFIRYIYVGGPSLPLDEQVRIVWRVPEPTAPKEAWEQ